MKRRDRERRFLPSLRRAALACLAAIPLLIAAGSCAGGAGAPPERRGTAARALSTGVVVATRPMILGRSGHTATLLSNGKVLLAGGRADDAIKGRTAELYDPATGRTVATAQPMNAARSGHTATLLPSGEVLLAGGASSLDAQGTDASTSAELYDPGSDRFRAVSLPLRSARADHTATLLPGGEVLLTGGTTSASVGPQPSASGLDDPGASGSPWAELYHPGTETFTATKGGMLEPRNHHTATLLPGGRVLLIGGDDSDELAAVGQSAELYDAASESFTATAGAPLRAFSHHTATLLRGGQVLLTGGLARPLPDGGREASAELREAELYDPASDLFTATASLARFRSDHSATLLPSGRVMLAGGPDEAGSSLEVFDPGSATFSPTENLPSIRNSGHTATLLPTGAVLVAGGSTIVGDGSEVSPDTFLYDPSEGGFGEPALAEVARALHTATLLLDGEVLLAGGFVGSDTGFFPAAEIYSPRDRKARPTQGHMHNLRARHTATLLASGEVLISGGLDKSGGADADTSESLSTAELYRPDGDDFLVVHPMSTPRANHTATLLASGEVLIAGGSITQTVELQTAELYDPLPRLFFDVSSPMLSPRSGHVAARLRSGEVLIAGGYWGQDALRSAEIYDPRTGAFRPTGSMQSAHSRENSVGFTATLLASGRVLIVGLDAAELFDPEADGERGAFLPAAAGFDGLAHRNGHTATLLPSGKVLITGGTDSTGAQLSTGALYDPALDRFLAQADLLRPRGSHTATLLPSSDVLLAGGFDINGIVETYERWDDELPQSSLVPHLTQVPRAPSGESAHLGGTGFLSTFETGGGASNSSATRLPLALWLPMAGGLTTGTLREMTDSSAEWLFPAARLDGPGMLFLSSGGRRSEGAPLSLGQDRACRSNGDCPEGQACSSAGVCGDPVVSGPPSEACSCRAVGAPRSSFPGALAVALLGVAAVRRRAVPRWSRRG